MILFQRYRDQNITIHDAMSGREHWTWTTLEKHPLQEVDKFMVLFAEGGSSLNSKYIYQDPLCIHPDCLCFMLKIRK